MASPSKSEYIRWVKGSLNRLVNASLADDGTTVFVSSHLLAEIELTCDRVAIIHRGRILRAGTVNELISSRRAMEFRVSDTDAAAAILRDRELEYSIDGERLFVPIDEDDAAAIVSTFTAAGLAPVKVNVVVKRGLNEAGILPMARRFRGTGVVLRFIEYMDVGHTNGWRLDDVVPAAE